MSNYTEYVFCPHCGGITAPGTCVNCGKPTSEGSAEAKKTTSEGAVESKIMSEVAVESKTTSEEKPMVNTSSYTEELQKSYGQYLQYETQSNNMYGQNVHTSQMAPVYNTQQQYDNVYADPKPAKKSRWWILLVVIGGFVFIGLVVSILAVFAAIAVPIFMGTTADTTQSVSVTTVPAPVPVTTEEVTFSEVEEDLTGTHIDAEEFALEVYQRSFGRFDLSYMDLQAEWDDADLYTDAIDGVADIYLAQDYVSTFGSNHDNHSLEAFTGTYYEPFVDCIDDSYDYGLTRHYMEYYNYANDVHLNAYIAYYELTGDVIPNQDALNDEIFRLTAHDLLAQLDGFTDYGWYTGSALILVDSFVTYNDGEKMSILLDVNISEDGVGLAESYIYGINIDLVNGVIMDNDSILVADSDFAAIFRERCCTQNGTDIDGLNYLEDDEVATFLGDGSTNIVFYTPYGMEYGYAYELSDGTKGWMTITLGDYEEYLQ